ncbi:DnaJ domain-containing protein [Tanacetum coccineum]
MVSNGDERSDFYQVLGLKKGCTDVEVKNAYKKLAMRWHPDRCSAFGSSKHVEEANKKFQAINEAYSGKRGWSFEANLKDLFAELGFKVNMSHVIRLLKQEARRLIHLCFQAAVKAHQTLTNEAGRLAYWKGVGNARKGGLSRKGGANMVLSKLWTPGLRVWTELEGAFLILLIILCIS